MKIFGKVALTAAVAIAAAGLALNAYAQDVITTVVGNGPTGIPALNANFNDPLELAMDSAGNIYVAGYNQHRVFKVAPGGNITLIAGVGIAGYSGDGGLATAANLNSPQGVAVDSKGNIFISDTNNCLVRKVEATTGIITTVAGVVIVPASGAPYPQCGYNGEGAAANKSNLSSPDGLSINQTTGDLYIADYSNGLIRKVAGGAATGTISTVAGSGGSTTTGNNCQSSAPFGDGGLATNAYLCNPARVTVDASVTPVNIFISDTSRCVVREVVGASKDIYQIAGSYTSGCGFADASPATSGQVSSPNQITVQVGAKTTTLQLADQGNNRIRQILLTYTGGKPTPGSMTTIAGNGSGYGGDGGPALSAGINQPIGLVLDKSDNLYVAAIYDYRIREIAKGGKTPGYINTIAGWGQTNYSDPVGISGAPGGGVALFQPLDVFADPASTDVYVSTYSTQNTYLYNSATTDIANFAGNGIDGYTGDGTSATGTGTELNYPQGVVKDTLGNVYIGDANNCAIRRVATSGTIHTYAGGTDGSLVGCGYSGDGGPADKAQFNRPAGMAIDSANNIYLADYYNCLIRKITPGGTVTTVAGLVTTVNGTKTAGNCGSSSDGGSALAAELYNPTGVGVDGAGNIYIADASTDRIRKVDINTGLINTVAGNERGGYSGDGPALQNSLNQPQRLDVDTNGNIFFGDYYNNIVRWVDPGGMLTTFAGTPTTYGFGGDGGTATKAIFTYPSGVTQDTSGNFYVVDYNNERVRKVSAFPGYGRSTGAVSFSDQPTGTTSDYQSIYLSAIGPVTINSITAPAGFSELDDCAGVALTTGETCEIDVQFAPTKTGKTEGLLSVSSNAFLANQGSTVLLSGTATGLVLSGPLAFGAEPLNTTTKNTLTLTNSGASVTLKTFYFTKTTYFSVVSGGTCPLTGGTLAGGASCTLVIAFDPTTTGAHTNTLVIPSSDPSGPLLASASGTGTEVKVSTASVAFGNAYYRNPTTQSVTVTNTGSTSFTVKTAISGTGASSFTVTGCTATVAAGGNCTLALVFNPAGVATYAATLTLTTTGGSNPTVALSGTGIAADSATPASLAFGTLAPGASNTLNVTVKNSGPTATLTISTAFSGTGAAAYHVAGTGDTCTGPIAAGASCVLPVKFEPTADASYPATLTITTNGGTSPAIALTGAGS